MHVGRKGSGKEMYGEESVDIDGGTCYVEISLVVQVTENQSSYTVVSVKHRQLYLGYNLTRRAWTVCNRGTRGVPRSQIFSYRPFPCKSCTFLQNILEVHHDDIECRKWQILLYFSSTIFIFVEDTIE